MPSDLDLQHQHLAWRLEPQAIAAEHLRQCDGISLKLVRATDEVAVLYFLDGDAPPRALTWQDYCGPHEDRRLLREVNNGGERLNAWFSHIRAMDIWRIAAAWEFYLHWVIGYNVPEWRECVEARFSSNPFLDEVLAISFGWILWKFQVQLICRVAIDINVRAHRASEAWCRLHWERPKRELWLPSGTVPGGAALRDVLYERSWREKHGLIAFFDWPNLHLAHLLRTLS